VIEANPGQTGNDPNEIVSATKTDGDTSVRVISGPLFLVPVRNSETFAWLAE
jgi:hypothetical protein